VCSSAQDLRSSAAAVEHKELAIERVCARAQEPQLSALHVHTCFPCSLSPSLSCLCRGNSEKLRMLERT
jgi:hypothetical protein